MRTPKLLIIAIKGVQGPEEVEQGASGLYAKYSNRSQFNKEVKLEYLSRSGKLVQGKGQGELAIGDGDTVGMYIVAHCGDLLTAITNHDLVSSIKTMVLDAAKVGENTKYTLDKVCLVVCGTAANQNGYSVRNPITPQRLNDEDEQAKGLLLLQFSKLLLKAGLTPRLAGWAGFVTVDKTGKKRIYSSQNNLQGYASDLSKSRAKQKMVYVWDAQNGYLKKELADWTDNK